MYILGFCLALIGGAAGILIGYASIKKNIDLSGMDWTKFLSRKFLVGVAGVVVGLAKGFGLDIETETLAIVEAVAATYILVEGYLDKKKIEKTDGS